MTSIQATQERIQSRYIGRFDNKLYGSKIREGVKLKVLKSRKFDINEIVFALCIPMKFAISGPWSVKCVNAYGKKGWLVVSNTEIVD